MEVWHPCHAHVCNPFPRTAGVIYVCLSWISRSGAKPPDTLQALLERTLSPEPERVRAYAPTRKIIVVRNGAPYHRANAVLARAKELDITSEPLPGY